MKYTLTAIFFLRHKISKKNKLIKISYRAMRTVEKFHTHPNFTDIQILQFSQRYTKMHLLLNNPSIHNCINFLDEFDSKLNLIMLQHYLPMTFSGTVLKNIFIQENKLSKNIIINENKIYDWNSVLELIILNKLCLNLNDPSLKLIFQPNLTEFNQIFNIMHYVRQPDPDYLLCTKPKAITLDFKLKYFTGVFHESLIFNVYEYNDSFISILNPCVNLNLIKKNLIFNFNKLLTLNDTQINFLCQKQIQNISMGKFINFNSINIQIQNRMHDLNLKRNLPLLIHNSITLDENIEPPIFFKSLQTAERNQFNVTDFLNRIDQQQKPNISYKTIKDLKNELNNFIEHYH